MRLTILIITMATIGIAPAGLCQFSGQLVPAGTVLKGTSQGSGNVGIYDDARCLIGSYRYGLAGYTDIGARFGFIDFDDNNESGVVLGGDIKYQLLEVRIQDPLDFSIGGLFETVFGAGNFLSVGSFVVGSYPLKLQNGKSIRPYGRIVFRIEWYEAQSIYNKGWENRPPGADIKDEVLSDFDIGLNAGASMELNENSSVSAELQFDDDLFGLLIAINFSL